MHCVDVKPTTKMADFSAFTVDGLKKFKVVELKAKLSEVGLPISGLKSDLVERLHKYYVAQSIQQEEQEQQNVIATTVEITAEPSDDVIPEPLSEEAVQAVEPEPEQSPSEGEEVRPSEPEHEIQLQMNSAPVKTQAEPTPVVAVEEVRPVPEESASGRMSTEVGEFEVVDKDEVEAEMLERGYSLESQQNEREHFEQAEVIEPQQEHFEAVDEGFSEARSNQAQPVVDVPPVEVSEVKHNQQQDAIHIAVEAPSEHHLVPPPAPMPPTPPMGRTLPPQVIELPLHNIPVPPQIHPQETWQPQQEMSQEPLVQQQPSTEEAGLKTKKKKKKKKRRKRAQEVQMVLDEDEEEDDVDIEYVTESLDPMDPNYRAFAKIFEAFKLSEPENTIAGTKKEDKKEDTTEAKKEEVKDISMQDEDDEEIVKPAESDQPKLSKKKLRKMNRLSVAELKQLVPRPDVVEMHDVTAQDPKLLVFLKSCRNTVPVPRHWCFKRKYLQGKRGIVKPAFELPEFIKKTGIMEMREAMQEKEEQKTLKAKMREKVRPKMGKINIDYQKLHDAFFKWQTKPKMSIHGDLYYEGKEFETKLKEKKPGDLSDDLKTALGMPVGPASHLVPPPWLIAMQRYGPPPSYPNLKVAGLNAPIPEGASFGYHAGGWGKPPVDETGRPLYGDVFGTQSIDINEDEDEEGVEKQPWGELESEESEEESSEEESSSEEEDNTGLITPADTGLVTPSGLTSIPTGMETPDMIELRKKKSIEEAMEVGAEQPSLYTMLQEKRSAVGGAMMGSTHVYELPVVAPGVAKKAGGGTAEGIEVALDPSELELDPAAMQARYEAQMKERENQIQKEDLSDMVAEHAAKQKKRKKATDSGKAAKKYKEFKF